MPPKSIFNKKKRGFTCMVAKAGNRLSKVQKIQFPESRPSVPMGQIPNVLSARKVVVEEDKPSPPRSETRRKNWASLLLEIPKAYLEGIGHQEPKMEALAPVEDVIDPTPCACPKAQKMVTCVFMCGKYKLLGCLCGTIEYK